MTGRLTADQNIGLTVLLLKRFRPKIEGIKSFDVILKRKNSLRELTASIIKCPGIMCLASDIDSDNHCCICHLLNLLILCIIHLEPPVLIVLFTSAKMQLNHTLRFFFIQLALLMNYRNAPIIFRKSSSERIGMPSSLAFLFFDELDVTSLLIR